MQFVRETLSLPNLAMLEAAALISPGGKIVGSSSRHKLVALLASTMVFTRVAR